MKSNPRRTLVNEMNDEEKKQKRLIMARDNIKCEFDLFRENSKTISENNCFENKNKVI